MKKDTTFRIINGISLAANAYSMCMPLTSPQYAFARFLSAGCHFISYGMLKRQDEIKNGGLKMMPVRHSALLSGIHNIASPDSIQMAFITDSLSMTVNALNLYGGLNLKENALDVILIKRKQNKNLLP